MSGQKTITATNETIKDKVGKGSSMGLKGSEFFAVKTDFLSVLK